jgi:hypothetical protein
MFVAYEKCLRLLRNVCGLWEMFASAEKCLRPMKMELKKGKIRNQKLEREQLNNYNFQRNG